MAGVYGSQSREDYSEDDIEHYFNYMGMLATEVRRPGFEFASSFNQSFALSPSNLAYVDGETCVCGQGTYDRLNSMLSRATPAPGQCSEPSRCEWVASKVGSCKQHWNVAQAAAKVSLPARKAL